MASKKAMLRRRRRRRRRILAAALTLAVVAAVAAILLLHGPEADEAVPAAFPEPTQAATAVPTPEPTPEVTPEPTPEPTQEVYIPIHLYAPDGSGTRYRLTEYVCNWRKGKDIDCFEALVSDAETLTGKNFLSICKEAWMTLPDPYVMRIGYTLRYTLSNGQTVNLVIRSPGDISHTEYVECYLYDDVHQKGGFYTHLSESQMNENTLITSIKITCGDRIGQVEEMWLGAFLYDSEERFDETGRYIGPWYSEIPIRRKA